VRDALTRVGGTVGTGVRSILSPAGLRGAAVEIAWLAAHVALYPTGLARERDPAELGRYSVRDMPLLERALVIGDIEAAGTPILLVHGLVDNRSVFTLLRRRLRRRGFGRVVSMNYSPLTDDVRTAATLLAERVEELCDQTGYERIHVIGHSLGGLIARYYVQCLGGDDRVHTLVTLGSPHRGTLAAHLIPHPLIRQLRPGSPIIGELEAPAPDCQTRFVAFYTDLDHLIVPAANGRVDHPDLRATNILAPGVGHTSLPVRGWVVHRICTTLALLDPDAHEHGAPEDEDREGLEGERAGTPEAERLSGSVTPITALGANHQHIAERPECFTTSVREKFGPT
jgi:triacylglycerol lipase